MTISVVQYSQNGTLPNPVTAGNTIVYAPITYSTSNVTIGASGVTWGSQNFVLYQFEQSAFANNATVAHQFWVMKNANGGSLGITPTLRASTNLNGSVCYEIAGLPSPAADLTAVNTGNGTAVSVSGNASGSISPEITFGATALYGGSSGAPTGSSWTAVEDGSQNGWVGYIIDASPGGSYSWSQTGNATDPWTAGILSLYSSQSTVAGLAATATATAPAGTAVPGSQFQVAVSAKALMSFNAHSSISAQATMEFEAGTPVQTGLTTLASDSWISMYPG